MRVHFSDRIILGFDKPSKRYYQTCHDIVMRKLLHCYNERLFINIKCSAVFEIFFFQYRKL